MRRWHRWTGIIVSVVVAILAVTGILLNHTDSLGLPDTTVTFAPVVAFYGLDGRVGARHVALGSTAITQVEHVVYLGDRAIGELDTPLVGAAVTSAGIMAAAGGELQLYTTGGQLVERMLPAFGLPTPISALGSAADGRPLLRAAGELFVFNPALFDWQPAAGAAFQASQVVPGVPADFAHPPPAPGVSLEHLLLDLHTGRVLGRVGPWLNDLGALGLCFLAATGLWIALRR